MLHHENSFQTTFPTTTVKYVFVGILGDTMDMLVTHRYYITVNTLTVNGVHERLCCHYEYSFCCVEGIWKSSPSRWWITLFRWLPRIHYSEFLSAYYQLPSVVCQLLLVVTLSSLWFNCRRVVSNFLVNVLSFLFDLLPFVYGRFFLFGPWLYINVCFFPVGNFLSGMSELFCDWSSAVCQYARWFCWTQCSHIMFTQHVSVCWHFSTYP